MSDESNIPPLSGSVAPPPPSGASPTKWTCIRPSNIALAEIMWENNGNVIHAWRAYRAMAPEGKKPAKRTFQKWVADPKVRRLMRQIKGDSVASAMTTFAKHASIAADTIVSAMTATQSPDRGRIEAARLVLDYAKEGVTIESLQLEVAELQSLVTTLLAARNGTVQSQVPIPVEIESATSAQLYTSMHADPALDPPGFGFTDEFPDSVTDDTSPSTSSTDVREFSVQEPLGASDSQIPKETSGVNPDASQQSVVTSTGDLADDV